MAYNRVDPRLWESGSFLRLSRVECSGQALWLYLLTCPQRHSSGIFRVGRGAIEDLTQWSRESLDKSFDELFQNGMVEFDWTANVLRFVNATKHLVCENRNVAVSWVKHIEALPRIPLVSAHAIELEPFIERLGCSFGESFTKRMGNSPTPTPTPTPAPTLSIEGSLEGFEDWYKSYPRKVARPAAEKAWKKMPPEDRESCATLSPKVYRGFSKDPKFIPHPATFLNQRRWEDDVSEAEERSSEAQKLSRQGSSYKPVQSNICDCGNDKPAGFISCRECSENGGWLDAYNEFVSRTQAIDPVT